MEITVAQVQPLWFTSGAPVRAASGVAPLGDGWLVAQDDSIHGAWWRPGVGTVEPIALLPPRGGLASFSEAEGTKRLKPDLESACRVRSRSRDGVLLLGSGSLVSRMEGVLVLDAGPATPTVRSLDLAALYDRVRDALGLGPDQVNLEGVCVIGQSLRWFQRGHGPSGVSSASVDLDLPATLGVFDGLADPGDVEVGNVRRYDLGELGGLPLAITDVVVLPDGRACISATAEDAPDAVADGPVAGSALALLDRDGRVLAVTPMPGELAGCKVEGLAVVDTTARGATLLAVVDQDDPDRPSTVARLGVRW